jgi:hypothetical protein
MTGRNLKDQVREAISDLPINAARFAVAGVGRVVTLTDRIRKDLKDAGESNFAPIVDRLRDDAKHARDRVGEDARHLVERAGDLLFATEAPDDESPAERPEGAAPARTPSPEISVGKPKPAAKTTASPSTTSSAEVPAAPQVDLPVPDYHQATLASVRARLRVLDESQIKRLREYEVRHENRESFVKMYDNRLTKLRAERS